MMGIKIHGALIKSLPFFFFKYDKCNYLCNDTSIANAIIHLQAYSTALRNYIYAYKIIYCFNNSDNCVDNNTYLCAKKI